MEQKFYILVDEIQQGPFSIEELKKKNLNKNTLVWFDDLENWEEARNIKELEKVLMKNPPPIPTNAEKPIKVQAEITKKKERLINTSNEVAIAKETKSVFKQIRYGLIIGIISFPIFYFGIYQASKYDNYDIDKNVSFDGTTRYAAKIDVTDFPFPLYLDPQSLRDGIKQRRRIYAEKSAYSSLITFLLASGTIIIIRYVSKGVKWVDETSKKEL